MPDHRRGYVVDKQVLPTNPDMARRYEQRATQPPVLFTDDQLAMLLSGVIDICKERNWKLFVFASEPTHFHIVIGWRGYLDCVDVRDTITNLLSLFLGKQMGVRGRRWFARKPSRRRVKNRRHLNYLLDEYLPRHRKLFWRHDRGAPPPPLSRWIDVKRHR